MNKTIFIKYLIAFLIYTVSNLSYAAISQTSIRLDLTNNMAGYVAVFIFILAYIVVMTEELTGMRKSKPVLLSAGIVWAIIAFVYAKNGISSVVHENIKISINEFAELFLFLLVAMTYIEALKERNLFNALKIWLIKQNFTLKQLFWATGFIAFFLSPIADNLTTALIMGTVIMTVGGNNTKFITLSLINIVVSANAGGAFSPFGDITTLMVWQKGVVSFSEFLNLFLPSLVNFIIPAFIMSFFIDKKTGGYDDNVDTDIVVKTGGITIAFLFLCTIITAILYHNSLHLPPAIGMMTGLGYLAIAGYYIRKFKKQDFDVFRKVSRAEWDTLLFFFGIILTVGGLGLIGYLELLSNIMYNDWGPTAANFSVGILSAIIDNIPVMFAVLTMNPDMSLGQWLLVTLTAGVGGSMLSIGSAAGVAIMGQSKGLYTFGKHLKWTPVIFLGYVASIMLHLWINADLF